MKLIDLHCDTIFEMYGKEKKNLKNNGLRVDLSKLRAVESTAQFFACFIYMQMFKTADRWDKGYKYALEMLAYAKNVFSKYPLEICETKTYEEFCCHEREKIISAFLTIEEGGIVNDKMERLEELYNQGVRLMTLTWNEENCMGFPNSCNRDVMQSGLKPFGIETVKKMNALGMIIDVSHLSDGGFWDVLRYSEKPIVASHSNARSLCAHPRNLTDEMIRAMAEKGGVGGINFYPYFINHNGEARVTDLVRHIEHMYRIGGEDFVAVGTDFDGFDDGKLELLNIGEIGILHEMLKKKGFFERQIEKFWNGNAKRILKEIL